MGAAQAGYGMATMGQARRQEALLRAQGLPKMQTPQEYYDLYQNASRSRAFEQEKAMTESIMASNLNTLASAGSRALIGAAPGVALQAQRGLAGAAERDFQRQQKALESLAAAEARTAGFNFQQESAQYAADLAGAQAGFQAGAETAVSGLDTAIGAGTMAYQELNPKKNTLLGVDDTKVDDTVNLDVKSTETVTPVTETPQVVDNSGAFKRVMGRDIFDYPGFTPSGGSGLSLFDPNNNPADQLSSQIQEVVRGYNYGNPAIPPRRGPNGFAEGGSVTTPGKYTADHSLEYDVKTKDGKTIATLTGGETLVFNPQQRRFLKRIIGRLLKGQKVQLGKNETKTANETLKAFKK